MLHKGELVMMDDGKESDLDAGLVNDSLEKSKSILKL